IGIGQWSTSSGLTVQNIDSASTIVTGASFGIYIFNWTVTNGTCQQSDSVQITVNANPQITVDKHYYNLCKGEQVTLIAGGANFYVWSPPNNLSDTDIYNPVATASQTITYTVTGTTNGCSSSDTVRIEICNGLTIPNGFSPDGDGVNDYFEI